jgi:membrane glycosyltransferase
MLIQSRHVFEVFMGRDSGWKPQRRDGGGTTWSDAWHFHKRHMLLSCMTGVIVWFLSPPLLAWLSPALLGLLLLAVPLSRASGSEAWVKFCRSSRCCARPKRRDAGAGRAPPGIGAPGRSAARRRAAFLARNRDSRLSAYQRQSGRGPRSARPSRPHAFTAEQKLKDARSLDEALHG